MSTIELTSQQEERLYKRFWEMVDSMAFGYGKLNGEELIMLKRFYTPQDVMYVLDMPTSEFFTTADFAEIEGISEEEAEAILVDLTQRGNIYREKKDGVYNYHAIPAAHGIFEFHTRWLEPEWVGSGLIPTMSAPEVASGTYNAGVPFYHALPVNKDYVEEGQLLEEDDLFKLLASKRRWAVCPCDCLSISRDMFTPDQCDHPTNVCIQTDDMADYYVDDLKTGHDITLEEAEAILKRSIENGLVIQTTFSKKTEIFCSCSLCHCGILPGLKYFPGDAADSASRYFIKYTAETCLRCGACAERCPMQAISMDEETGLPLVDHSCVGCGQCVGICPTNSRILNRKPDARVHDYAEDLWESYAWMENHRREAGRL